MRFLTKQEELFLLSIARLQDPAYLVNIQQHLLENTGRDWAFGSLYITLAVALFTVSFQSIKAATANPIDCLRYE